MGLFKDVGRKVERFKQAAKDVAEEEATRRCTDCGKRFYTDQETCPECGGAVEAVEPTGSEPGTDPDAEPEAGVDDAETGAADPAAESGPVESDDEAADADDETTDPAA